MSFHVRGIGTSVPPGYLTPDEGLGVARVIGGPTSRASGFLPSVYAHSGNKMRHVVHGRDVVRDLFEGTRDSGSVFLPNGDPNFLGPTTAQRNAQYAIEAPKLAVPAASDALKEAGFAADSITHLVTVSCTGFFSPGVDFALIRGLGLRPTVERTHVGFMGCHGALNGLRVANAYATADPNARVMLCAVELCSLHYHYRDEPEKVVANALFADGCAVIVGDGVRDANEWAVSATGSSLIPDSTEAMTWTILDHGFEMTLSKQVPKLIAANVAGWMHDWLKSNNLTVADIGSWAIHPGGPKILEAVQDALALPASALETSKHIFANYGNMSSPTVLFILNAMRKVNVPRPCVMLGFGPGLMAEAVLMR